jgi:outer membrane receptor protein involved in Fe transport
MPRSRRSRLEEPLSPHVPEPIIDPAEGTDPEHEALLADAVGLALLVVLQTLSPPERLAYVLHDMFDMSFDEIAPIVVRSPRRPANTPAAPGAAAVASQALTNSRLGLLIKPVLINGTPGVISSRDGQPFSVIGFTVTAGKITEIDILADPDRLQQLDLSAFDDQQQ